MKKLLLILTFVLFSFNTYGNTIEDMYKECKPYQSNGFKVPKDFDRASGSLGCAAFFKGYFSAMGQSCGYLKNLLKNKYISSEQFNVLAITSSLDINANMNSIIQGFIIIAENNPNKKWNEPFFSIAPQLNKMFPCKLQ